MLKLKSVACNLRQNIKLLSTASFKMQSAATSQAAAESKLTTPVPENVEKPPNPKLLGIVNEISSLNLLEVSELSSLLKKTLNLPETSFMPAMAATSQDKSGNSEEEEAAPKKVQTAFKVKLVNFDDKQKVALIKEIKSLMEGMNLVQAKKFVESVPTYVKENIPKDEADKLKDALVKVGAIIEIE